MTAQPDRGARRRYKAAHLWESLAGDCQQARTSPFIIAARCSAATGALSDEQLKTSGAQCLDAVVLKDGRRIALAAATLRCPMAEAVARWVRQAVAPAVANSFGSPIQTIVIGTSYECRGGDGDPGAKVIEHDHANALDLRGLKLANGMALDFADKSAPEEFHELVRQSACASFTTVLGSREPHPSRIDSKAGWLPLPPLGCADHPGVTERALPPEGPAHPSATTKRR
jgi:hypothetical protein